MKEKILALLRPTKKWYDIFIVSVILSLLLFYAGQYLSAIGYIAYPVIDFFQKLVGSYDGARFMYMYFAFFGIWVFFVLFCLPKRNHKILGSLRRGSWKVTLIGLAVGFGTNALCILFAVLHRDIFLSFNKFSFVPFFSFLICVCIQSGAEEIVDRSYVYQKLRRRYKNPAVAIAGNSLIFGAMHLGNPGVTVLSVIDIFLTGIAFSLFVYYYDDLWAAILMHTGWNFSQSIFFGLPNSGIVSAYSVFKLEAASARDSFFYSAGFGVEGSVFSILVQLATIIVLILLNTGKGEANDIWAEDCERLAVKDN